MVIIVSVRKPLEHNVSGDVNACLSQVGDPIFYLSCVPYMFNRDLAEQGRNSERNLVPKYWGQIKSLTHWARS